LEQLAARIDIRNGIIASDPWHWNYHDTARWLHGGVRFVKTAFPPVTAYPFRRVDFTSTCRQTTKCPSRVLVR
jgi:hypothetical protein